MGWNDYQELEFNEDELTQAQTELVTCPDCGEVLSTEKEERADGIFEWINTCRACGYTEVEK